MQEQNNGGLVLSVRFTWIRPLHDISGVTLWPRWSWSTLNSQVSGHPPYFSYVIAHRFNSRRWTVPLTDTFSNSRGCPLRKSRLYYGLQNSPWNQYHGLLQSIAAPPMLSTNPSLSIHLPPTTPHPTVILSILSYFSDGHLHCCVEREGLFNRSNMFYLRIWSKWPIDSECIVRTSSLAYFPSNDMKYWYFYRMLFFHRSSCSRYQIRPIFTYP